MNRAAQPSRATLIFAGQLLAMLVLFRLLDVVVTHLAALPASAYDEPFFLASLPRRWWGLLTTRVPWWLAALAAALCVGAAVVDARRLGGAWRRRVASLGAPWDAVHDGAALRLLVVGITGITTWALVAYAHNLYAGQWHVADRLLLLVCWAAIAWRPAFVVPYAILAGAVAGQFSAPLGFISWTEMGVLLRLPVLVAAFWTVRAATDERRADLFVFGWCCLVAVTYWTSGLGKLRIEWFTHPHMAMLMLGAYANGWIASVDAATMARAAELLGRVARPLMLVTLVLECGALVMLWRRWSLVGFLVLAILFHTSVFAMTGICFWKWVMADAFLLLYLLRGERLARLTFFAPARFALSVAAIVASPLWMRAENLTWYDTPLTYSLRYEGVDARGVTHALPAGFFRPFSDAIVLGTFAQVSPYVQLTRGMGVTSDRRLAEALVAARTPDDIFALEARLGRVRTDSVAVIAFDDFVSRTAAHARCSSQRDPVLLRIAGAPRHLWTLPLHDALPCDVSLAAIRVYEETSFYDGTALRVVRRRMLREVATAQ